MIEEIKSNVNNWIRNYLPGLQFRQYQEEYIIKTIQLILNGNKLTIIEAPTGSGKSIMIIVMAGVLQKYYHMSSYILCSDLFLWQQYADIIEKNHLYFGKIKGATDNYICERTGNDYSVAPCKLMGYSATQLMMSAIPDYDCANTCQYIIDRQKALNSEVTLMPYQMWLIYMNIIKGQDNSTVKTTFNNRPVIFCDECHNIPSICQSFAEITLDLHKDIVRMSDIMEYCADHKLILSNGTAMKDFDMCTYLCDYTDLFNKIADTNDYDYKTLHKLLDSLSGQLSTIHECISTIEEYKLTDGFKKHLKTGLNKTDIKAFKSAEYISRLIHMVNMYQVYLYDEKWLIKSDNKVYDKGINTGFPDNPMIMFKFAKEDIWCHEFLLKHPDNIVMMSATIGGKEAFDDNIGTSFTKKESVMMTIPSTFDFSKSPVYFIPGTKMTQKEIGDSFPINAAIINKILLSPKHQNEKGIIHTGSYKNAIWLQDLLDKSLKDRVFIYGSSKEKQDVIADFAKSKNGILIGPTLTEGVDLPNDGCRYIIIMKIPYPYLGDNLVKAKLDLFPKWYSSTTSNNVIQGIGRGNRHKDDWSTTYILDGCFYNLYMETASQYPVELRNRIKILNK